MKGLGSQPVTLSDVPGLTLQSRIRSQGQSLTLGVPELQGLEFTPREPDPSSSLRETQVCKKDSICHDEPREHSLSVDNQTTWNRRQEQGTGPMCPSETYNAINTIPPYF